MCTWHRDDIYAALDNRFPQPPLDNEVVAELGSRTDDNVIMLATGKVLPAHHVNVVALTYWRFRCLRNYVQRPSAFACC
jgi:hypothetical protein